MQSQCVFFLHMFCEYSNREHKHIGLELAADHIVNLRIDVAISLMKARYFNNQTVNVSARLKAATNPDKLKLTSK